MRILIVSTLRRAVSADTFASRSRVIYELASELVKKGHEVSLLGTADSKIPGVTIIPVIEKGWVDLPPVENEFLRQMASLMDLTRQIIQIQDSFDIIHNHTYPDFFPSVIEDKLHIPMVSTLYALYTDYIDHTLSFYPKTYYIALSQYYKNLYKKGHIYDVTYIGVDQSLYTFKQKKQDYLFWLGRLPKGKNADGSFLDPKGVRWAIELAKQTGKELLLAGACEDKKFFEKDVKPFLNEKIQWVGDVTREQSLPASTIVDLMQNAKAFLMTINQEEPFGLVMAEAMSCGTPVIAYAKGSVPEIIQDGKTGFIVNYSDNDKRGDWQIKETGVAGLAKAVNNLYAMSHEDYLTMQNAARERVEKNFSIDTMVTNHEVLYTKLVKNTTQK